MYSLFAARRTRHRTKRAFTLLELVVTLVVLGTLLALATPTFIGVQNTVSMNRDLDSLSSVATAAETIARQAGRSIPTTQDVSTAAVTSQTNTVVGKTTYVNPGAGSQNVVESTMTSGSAGASTSPGQISFDGTTNSNLAVPEAGFAMMTTAPAGSTSSCVMVVISAAHTTAFGFKDAFGSSPVICTGTQALLSENTPTTRPVAPASAPAYAGFTSAFATQNGGGSFNFIWGWNTSTGGTVSGFITSQTSKSCDPTATPQVLTDCVYMSASGQSNVFTGLPVSSTLVGAKVYACNYVGCSTPISATVVIKPWLATKSQNAVSTVTLTGAAFKNPGGVAYDYAASSAAYPVFYVADTYNNRILKVSGAPAASPATGTVYTTAVLAGTGTAGTSPGTSAATATFYHPTSLALANKVAPNFCTGAAGTVGTNSGGYLYVADDNGTVIRRIDLGSLNTATSVIVFAGQPGVTSVAGVAPVPTWSASTGKYNTLSPGVATNTIVLDMIGPGGISSGEFGGIAVSGGYTASTGTNACNVIYVADTAYNAILRISTTNAAASAKLYAGYTAGGGAAGSIDGTGQASMFNMPTGLAPVWNGGADLTGSLWVADTGNNQLRMVRTYGSYTGSSVLVYSALGMAPSSSTPSPPGYADGTISLLGAPTDSPLDYPLSAPVGLSYVTTDPTVAGILYVTEGVNGSGNQDVRAIFGGTLASLAAGETLTTYQNSTTLITSIAGARVFGESDSTVGAASFANPVAVFADTNGYVYTIDYGIGGSASYPGAIRKICGAIASSQTCP